MKEPESYDALRALLIDRGVSRLFELRECSDGLETDTAGADFDYNGEERFWTSEDLSWMIYASHESSITFGGTWLVEKMQSLLPEFNRYIYKTWDRADYV